MNVTKLKPVRSEKKKAFLIRVGLCVFFTLLLLFIIVNKVRIYNASGKMLICFKKLPKEDDLVCYQIGNSNKIAIFSKIRPDGTYKLLTLDKSNIISADITAKSYKGVVKLSIPLVFSLLHSKIFLLFVLIILIILYKRNEKLNLKNKNRKIKKNEIS